MSEPQAGRELDALVAEQIMGDGHWPLAYLGFLDMAAAAVCYRYESLTPLGPPNTLARFMNRRLPKYSTDIAAAWEVVEKLDLEWIEVQPGDEGSSVPLWAVAFWGGSETGGHIVEETAETAPLAICRAALAAVGVLRASQEGET